MNKKAKIIDLNIDLNSLGEGFLRADIDGNVAIANKVVSQMFGYESPEEMIGINMKKFYANPVDREEMLNKLKEKDKLINFELELRRKDGNTFWTLSNIMFLYDDKGAKIGTQAVIRDYTEIRQIKEKLVDTIQELQAANQQLSANEQQLQATNQQLSASEQQLQAANQQLSASEQQLRSTNEELLNNLEKLRIMKESTIKHNK